MTKQIKVITLLCIIIGCSDEFIPEVTKDPLEGLPNLGPIRFDSPAVGQRSYYAYFKAIDEGENVAFNYTGDTVVLAITNSINSGWEVKEFLTSKSVSKVNRTSQQLWTGFADSVFVSNLNFQSDSLIISRAAQAAYFSFLLPGQRISLQSFLVSEAEKNNPECLPLFGYASNRWVEYSANFVNFGRVYGRLNIHFDYRDMTTDGLGFMYAYSPSDGFVRLTWVSYWGLSVANGWDQVSL